MLKPITRYRTGVGILLAALGMAVWLIAEISAERDAAAAQLAEALRRLQREQSLISRWSHPTAAQRMEQKQTAAKREPGANGRDNVSFKNHEGEPQPALSMPVNLIYGPFRPLDLSPARERITVEELQALQELPPVKVEDFILRARLLNSKGESIQTMDLSGGRKGKIEMIREFPYPTEFDQAVFPVTAPETETDGTTAAAVPVASPTPQSFGLRNAGWTVELEMSSKGGLLQVRGLAENIGLELFNAQPGETGKPIYDEQGTLLDFNKPLQPSFTSRETPFFFDMLPGKTYRLPLNAGDEGTVLELTPISIN